MSYVKAMVEYFEDLSADKRLSLSPLSKNNNDNSKSHQEFEEDNDDLISYGSSDDYDHPNNHDVDEGDENTLEEEIPLLNNSSFTCITTKSSHDQFESSAFPSHHDIDEDDHTLVYSSDDDSTNMAEDRNILSRKVSYHTTNTVLIDNVSTPKITNIENESADHIDHNSYNKSTLNIVNQQGQSPLTLASISCQNEIMKLFISEGCDINLHDAHGASPLHHVCMNTSSNEKFSCLQLLLENGATVNCQDINGSTPLHLAAAHNCIESIKTLLAFGACPKIQDNKGNTALHKATQCQNIQIIKMLSEVKTCSDNLCTCKLPRSSTILIEPFDEYSDIHYSPMFQGERCPTSSPKFHNEKSSPPSSKSLEIWNRFFENATNCNVSCEEKFEADSLHDAIAIGDNVCVQSLLEQGKDINETDKFGNTPLHLASQRGDFQLIILLVENGAEVNCKNNNQETPRSICLSHDFTRCADYLHCHEKGSSILIQSFDLINHVFKFTASFINIFKSALFGMSETLPTTPSIPEDVAIALLEAKANNMLMIGQLEPPTDVKIALEKAGLK